MSCADILTRVGKHSPQAASRGSHLFKLQFTLVQTPVHTCLNSRKSYSCKPVCVPLLSSASRVLFVALASSDIK